jgi:hypothetical protein
LTLMAILPPDTKLGIRGAPLLKKNFHRECLLKERPLNLVISLFEI